MKTTLICCMHGEVDSPAGTVHISGDVGVHLTPMGIERMKFIGLNLSGKEGSVPNLVRPSAIFAAPDPWIVDAAKIVAGHVGRDEGFVRTHPMLACRNWGDLSGRKWSDIEQILLYQQRQGTRFSFCPDGGESADAYGDRSKEFVEWIVRHHGAETVYIFGRGSFLRSILHPVCGYHKDFSLGFYPKPGEVTHVVIDDSRGEDLGIYEADVDFDFARFLSPSRLTA